MRVPEDDADASQHAGVPTIYKTLFIYIYIYCIRSSRILSEVPRQRN